VVEFYGLRTPAWCTWSINEELVLCAFEHIAPLGDREIAAQTLEKVLTGWVAREKRLLAISRGGLQDARFKFFGDLPEDTFEAFLIGVRSSRGIEWWASSTCWHKQPHQHTGGEMEVLTTVGEQVGCLLVVAAHSSPRPWNPPTTCNWCSPPDRPAPREASSLLLFRGHFPRRRRSVGVIQFPRDQKRSDFSINDLKFASPTSGVAVGQLGQGRKRKPVALVHGRQRRHLELPGYQGAGLSLSILNERAGWMFDGRRALEDGRFRVATGPNSPAGLVTDGARWPSISSTKNRGWVAGRAQIGLYSTSDGGKALEPRWRDQRRSNSNFPSTTSYNWIAFAKQPAGGA